MESPIPRPQVTATVQIDDARVRVTCFDFPIGAETGWHEHGLDYVITTLTDCTMMLEGPDGATSEVMIEAGTTYRRDSGVRHNVINAGQAPMSFVEIELK
nr:cupin domain-containing protein [Sulfitobacter noctilucae]